MKVEEFKEKLKTLNMSLHGDLDAEKTAHVCALLDNILIQWEMTKVFY